MATFARNSTLGALGMKVYDPIPAIWFVSKRAWRLIAMRGNGAPYIVRGLGPFNPHWLYWGAKRTEKFHGARLF